MLTALSLLCCLVCSLWPCGCLLGKDQPLGCLVCDVILCFVNFSYDDPDQLWCLIVSIPDLCILLILISTSSDRITSNYNLRRFPEIIGEEFW